MNILDLIMEKQDFVASSPGQFYISGLRTHFDGIDKVLNGFQKGSLIILGGRPAMGKTTLALNIAENICFEEKKPVAIFSFAMSAENIVQRVIASRAEVETDKILKGSVDTPEFHRMVSCIKHMENYSCFIEDTQNISIIDIVEGIRALKSNSNIEFVLIDYLQLITGIKGKFYQNRYEEVADITRILKSIALETEIPILCISQLSRKVEERAGHRPMLTDLLDSGSIEQDADVVMFLLRREYYDPNDRPGQAEIIIAKNRHGPLDCVKLNFQREIPKFLNCAKQEFGLSFD